mmetsp:Transcript_52247/g.160897  ORF Transcript_52247/g.160897 Transcript_52247/m.160897 type:complete len:215 (+) Transcript_52247:185-829(+)
MRWHAGSVRMPCVAHATTRRAPRSRRRLTALTSVPAVSTMSSTMMHVMSFTLPTVCIASTLPASTRRFRIVTTPLAPTVSARVFARSTPPASGETMAVDAGSYHSCLRMYVANSGYICMLSRGMLRKKPWICPQCRSSVITRSTPIDWISCATADALIGTRDCVLRSWRLYPKYGTMAVMRFALDMRSVWMSSSSSMSAVLMSIFSLPVVGWMM